MDYEKELKTLEDEYLIQEKKYLTYADELRQQESETMKDFDDLAEHSIYCIQDTLVEGTSIQQIYQIIESQKEELGHLFKQKHSQLDNQFNDIQSKYYQDLKKLEEEEK